MWRLQPKYFEFSTPPLFPQTANMCNLSVCTYFIHQHILFHYEFIALTSFFSDFQEKNHLCLNQLVGEKQE